MITDIVLLGVLFGLLFGIIKLISVVSPLTPSTASRPIHAAGGTTVDWQRGELNLKTNRRPVTQQELLDRAQQTGLEGGKFVTQHADSFSFGNKEI